MQEDSSRAVVRHIRHTKPGRDGWTSTQEVIGNLDEIQGRPHLAWLINHSVSEGRGARIMSQYLSGELCVRAAPKSDSQGADTRTP